jgi:hydrogenase/urease accessory protein HupE
VIRPYIWAFLLFLFAAPAIADELRPGYLEFTQNSEREWTLVWKSPMTGGFTPSTQPELPSNCAVRGMPSREMANGSVVTKSSVTCIGQVEGQFIGLTHFDTAQSDVLVRVAPLTRPVQTLRLTPAEPRQTIVARPDQWQVARTYFITGIDHIIFGYDHLLFVVALVLLLSGAWTVFKAVTAFTIAHSITLVGTTLGLIGLPQRPVEIVIALSIMFLAVEIVKRKPGQPRLSERIPWVVAFGFGLLHGFGFAGALQEIGLPESDVPTALLTFNLGVEAGQLAIVAATIGVIAILQSKFAAWHAPVVKLATYAIGITAGFWFIERSLN